MSELLNSILAIQNANKSVKLKYPQTYEAVYNEAIEAINDHVKDHSAQHLDIEFFEYPIFESMEKQDRTYKQLVDIVNWVADKLEQEGFYAFGHVEYDSQMEEHLIWVNVYWADKVEIKF